LTAVSYRKCPKCGHQRAADETTAADSCAACGLIFSKYLHSRAAAFLGRRADRQARLESLDQTSFAARAKALLFDVPDAFDAVRAYAQAALLALLIAYGVKLARMDVPGWELASSLIHLPMVPIHEFGHVLFRPFGEFMHLLGGSLFQVGLPLVFGGIFLVKNRDPYSAAVMLWWSAVAVMDVAPYVYDAQQPQHVLLTGRTGENGAHDFIDILGDLGLLTRAQAVGYGVHRGGLVMLVTAYAWAGWLTYLQFTRRK
jgi:hypothetical protein